jgi:hypothetical protein
MAAYPDCYFERHADLHLLMDATAVAGQSALILK